MAGFGAGASANRVALHRAKGQQRDDGSVVASTGSTVDRAHIGLAGRMVAPVHTPVHAPDNASGHDSGQGTPPVYRSRPSTVGILKSEGFCGFIHVLFTYFMRQQFCWCVLDCSSSSYFECRIYKLASLRFFFRFFLCGGG